VAGLLVNAAGGFGGGYLTAHGQAVLGIAIAAVAIAAGSFILPPRKTGARR